MPANLFYRLKHNLHWACFFPEAGRKQFICRAAMFREFGEGMSQYVEVEIGKEEKRKEDGSSGLLKRNKDQLLTWRWRLWLLLSGKAVSCSFCSEPSIPSLPHTKKCVHDGNRASPETSWGRGANTLALTGGRFQPLWEVVWDWGGKTGFLCRGSWGWALHLPEQNPANSSPSGCWLFHFI